MFKRFFIIEQHAQKYEYVYPKSDLIKNVIEEPFLFPCNDIQKYTHDIFVVVLTEINGDHSFLISYFINNGKSCICFQSDYGWFELLYTTMWTVIRGQLYLPNKRNSLENYLTTLSLLPSPLPGLMIYVPGADPHSAATKVVVPTKIRQKPFTVFVAELRTRLQFEDWLIIFESLLLEKWIVFHSCHLDRVTNCIFAALSLIFPLEWVHLIFPCLSEASVNCLGCPSPYVAGVHSCLIERVYPLLSSGSVIVDIDQGIINYVCIENDASLEEDRLPKSLINFLWRSWSSCDMKIVASKRRSPMNAVEDDNVITQMTNGFCHVVAFLLGKYSRCKSWDSKTERFYVDKVALSSSRGELFQSFLGRLLQSQMVHQFLDERINLLPSVNEDSLTITLNDIDDFVEACVTMEKWQPDNYTDAIATMASKSKRRINVLANKVLDMAKKSELGTKTIDGNNKRFVSDSNDTNITMATIVLETPTIATEHIVHNNEAINRDNWITFEDNRPARVIAGGGVGVDLLTFDEWSPPETSGSGGGGGSGGTCPGQKHNIRAIIEDFDPLYQL